MAKKNWVWGLLAVTAVGVAFSYLYTDFWELAAGKVVSKKADMADFVTKYREFQLKKKATVTEDAELFQDDNINMIPAQNIDSTTVSFAGKQQKKPFSASTFHTVHETEASPRKADTTSSTTQNIPLEGGEQVFLPKTAAFKKQDTGPEIVNTDTTL